MKRQEEREQSQSLGAKAWRKFRRNRLAMVGVGILVFMILVTVLGANIRPDATEHANDQIPALVTKQPGFSIDILYERNDVVREQSGFFGRLAGGYDEELFDAIPVETIYVQGDSVFYKEYTEIPRKMGVLYSKSLVDVLYPLANKKNIVNDGTGSFTFLTADSVMTTDNLVAMQERIKEENIIHTTFWFGTDSNGRDFLSRLMAGTIISLLVGLISVLISLVIGIVMGGVAGYFRGWVDDAVMYVINVVWSIPTILLVFAITLMLGKGFIMVFIAVGLTMWVEVARIVRGQVLSVREKEFVEAGRALGFRSKRIIFRHVMPNVMGPVIVISAANFAAAILIEAGLSFLGIGTQLPRPSWANIVKEHFAFLDTDYSFLAILPGVCIIILVLAVMLIGNGLRDALDSRTSSTVSVAN